MGAPGAVAHTHTSIHTHTHTHTHAHTQTGVFPLLPLVDDVGAPGAVGHLTVTKFRLLGCVAKVLSTHLLITTRLGHIQNVL